MPDKPTVSDGDAPQNWERIARKQAARADHMEHLLRSALEVVGAIEDPSIDAFDDRLTCEQCGVRGWPKDGIVGDDRLAFCAEHALAPS